MDYHAGAGNQKPFIKNLRYTQLTQLAHWYSERVFRLTPPLFILILLQFN